MEQDLYKTSFANYPDVASIREYKKIAMEMLQLNFPKLYKDELACKEETVFTGTTKEAISLLPTKVNVAIATALSTVGPEKATAMITSVPAFPGDDHKLTVETEGLKAVVDIWSEKSDIAAWSVVALLRNLNSVITFF